MSEPLPVVLRGWGGATRGRSLLYRPTTPEGVAEAIRDARSRGLSVAARGGGQSYGDAALNEGGAVLDMTGLAGVLELDATSGRLRAQAGATIAEVWRAALPHGWWPAVVPGTMRVTVGGAVAMNVHGKNHARVGAIGRHVEELVLVTGEGNLVRVGRGAGTAPGPAPRMADVIGAQGLTGTLVEVTLRLHRVHSGFLRVHGWATRSLSETMEAVERGAVEADYSVAWVDCTGPHAGRGVLHHAWHAPPDHALAGLGLDLPAQALPRRVAGVLPTHQAWRVLQPWMSRTGIGVLNGGRYRAAAVRGVHRYVQSHAAFHFLLDHIPDWKRAYGPDGLLQYQMFVPAEAAREAFSDALEAQRRLGLPSYLAVMKRHAPEPESAAPYCLDGYSLAMDFPVGRGDRHARLLRLCSTLDRILETHGGRLYAAKDAVGRGALPVRRDPAFSSSLVRRWELG